MAAAVLLTTVWTSAQGLAHADLDTIEKLAALVAVVIIMGVTAVGTNLAVVFTTISGHLASAV